MKVKINKDRVEITELEFQNSGSVNYYEIECEFDDSWDGLTKEIVIAQETEGIHRAIINNKAYIDKEYSGRYTIGFVGYTIEDEVKTYQISTNLVPIVMVKGAGEISIIGETVPTPSEWDLYVAEINRLLNLCNADVETCQETLEDIEDIKTDVLQAKGLAETAATNAQTSATNAQNSAASAENVKNEVEKSVDGFDENVEKKTAEFNKNAEEKTTEFNKNTEQLYKDIESLESLAPLSTEAGTTIDIDNAKAYKMMGEVVDGKYQQETTTGKNKLSKDNLYSGIFISTTGGDDSFTQSKGYCCTKKINLYSATNITISGTQFFDMYAFYDKNNALVGSAVVKASTPIPKGATTVRIRFYKSAGDLPVETLKNENIQIEFNSVATPYEPYTGGQPSPNPDYPQEITQINSAVLNRCGKNMCLTTLKTYDWKGITIEKLSDGKYKVNGTAETDLDVYIMNNIKIPLVKDTYYKLSRKMWSGTTTAPNNGLCNCRMRTPNSSTWVWLQSSLPTAKKAPEDAYVDLVVFAVGKGITYTDYVFSVQLEEVESASSSATEYEAYNGQAININLDGNEICALSDTIKDQLIIDKNGNVVLQKNVAKLVLDGSENWQISPKYNCFCYYPGFVINMRSVNSISNIFREKSISQIKDNANFGMYTKYTSSLLIGYPNITLEEFKTFLNNNNLVLYYCMNEPQIIELPKLTEIPTMLDGINHVWVETNLGLTNIEIKYVEDLQREIEKLKTAIVALGGV